MEEVAEVLGGTGLFVVANLAARLPWLVGGRGEWAPPLGPWGEEGEGFFLGRGEAGGGPAASHVIGPMGG